MCQLYKRKDSSNLLVEYLYSRKEYVKKGGVVIGDTKAVFYG